MANVEYNSYHDDVMAAIREAEQTALLAVGILAKGTAVLLAPVAEFMGGTLRQSIDYQVEEDRVLIGSYAEYSIYVEKGTGIYAEDNDGRKTPWVYYDHKTEQYYYTKGQRPQPFIMPAVDRHRNDIIEIFEEELRKLGNSET